MRKYTRPIRTGLDKNLQKIIRLPTENSGLIKR
jgi:hypothetical protein